MTILLIIPSNAKKQSDECFPQSIGMSLVSISNHLRNEVQIRVRKATIYSSYLPVWQMLSSAMYRGKCVHVEKCGFPNPLKEANPFTAEKAKNL